MRLRTVAVCLLLAGCTASPGASPTPSVTTSSASESTPSQLDGMLNPAVTQATIGATICTVGYTATIRPPLAVTRKVKQELAAAAGVSVRTVVLDHVEPLEGGGAAGSYSDRRNFTLQTLADGKAKDRVEDRMHADVCAGRVPLLRAQVAMVTDWRRYRDLGLRPNCGTPSRATRLSPGGPRSC